MKNSDANSVWCRGSGSGRIWRCAEEVRVNIDLDRLQAVGVGLTDVLNELEARNQDISGGRILGDSEPLTRTIGRFQEAAEIGNLSFEVADTTARRTLHRLYLAVSTCETLPK